MKLNKAQKSFKDHMFSKVSMVENPEEEFSNLFNIGKIPLDARLKIYRNHIVTTLSNVLVMNFPLVEILTGTNFLKTAAKLYLFDNPPTEPCLDRYGNSFPEFLANYKYASHLPYLSDIARLDWKMNETRIAKDDNSLQRSDLAEIAPEAYETIIFKLKKSVRLISSPFPLDKIYSLCGEKEDNEDVLDISPEKTYILITRYNWEPQIRNLKESEYNFFLLLQEEKPLGIALEEILKNYPEFNFVDFLQNYIELETFSAAITK